MAYSPALSLRRRYIFQHLFFFGLCTGLIFLIFFVDGLLLSTVLALVIHYLLSPIVNALERTGLRRSLATLLVFALAGLVFSLVVWELLPVVADQLSDLRENLGDYVTGTARLMNDLETRLLVWSGGFAQVNLSAKAEALLMSWGDRLFSHLPNFIQGSATVSLLAPFFAYFLIRDGRKITQNLLAVAPNRTFEIILSLHHDISSQLAQFVQARLLESAIVGAIIWIGLGISGFPYAFILALFAGVLNLVPYIGPLIGVLPAAIIALVNPVAQPGLLIVLLVYTVAQLVDIMIIIPIVVAHLVDLHPAVVVVALIIGAQWLGILGLLIAIPIASALKVTATHLHRHFARSH